MPQLRPAFNTQNPHQQLLERIARRYEQLEGQLEQLEDKLLSADIPTVSEPPAPSDRSRQPR